MRFNFGNDSLSSASVPFNKPYAAAYSNYSYLFEVRYTKVECVFPMVRSSKFRMEEYEDGDHQYDASYFITEAKLDSFIIIYELERNRMCMFISAIVGK